MNIVGEILEQLDNIEYRRDRKSLHFEKNNATLFLEFLEFGPGGGQALSLEYSAESEKLEMHFERHSLCWLPYYLRDSRTEVFLYEFVDARQPLRMSFGAGSYLIQRACFLRVLPDP